MSIVITVIFNQVMYTLAICIAKVWSDYSLFILNCHSQLCYKKVSFFSSRLHYIILRLGQITVDYNYYYHYTKMYYYMAVTVNYATKIVIIPFQYIGLY